MFADANTKPGEIGLGALADIVRRWRTGNHLGAYGLWADEEEAYLFYDKTQHGPPSGDIIKTLHIRRGGKSKEDWEREVETLGWVASAKLDIESLLEYVRVLSDINPWNYI